MPRILTRRFHMKNSLFVSKSKNNVFQCHVIHTLEIKVWLFEDTIESFPDSVKYRRKPAMGS